MLSCARFSGLFAAAAVTALALWSVPAAAQGAPATPAGVVVLPPGAPLPAPPPPPVPAVPPAPPPLPAAPPGGWGLPPNITPLPGGGVAVTRTPQQGVDVHAQTSAGAVHAYGCSRVDADPTTRAQPAPCPSAYYPYAYPVYAPPPYYYMPPPPPPPLPPPARAKPRYAPDPARKGALIASSILFGVGTLGAGAAYVTSVDEGCDGASCLPAREGSAPALIALGGFLTVPASVPRFVVGDYGIALLLTGLRGGSFALGTAVDWEDETYIMPVTLAFVVPLTLGIVDLATTPHREQLEPKKPSDEAGLRLRGLAPTVARDRRGGLTPAVGAVGTF